MAATLPRTNLNEQVYETLRQRVLRRDPGPGAKLSLHELATELGADYVVNALTEDPVAAIQALGGAHASISVAVAPQAFEQAFASLRRGGTLVFVAMPADNTVRLPIFETVLNGLTIRGSIVGTRKDLAEVYAIHAQGRTRVIRETRKLDQVNECFDEVEKGQVKARIVFDLR